MNLSMAAERLPLRIAPYPDESLAGFLIRLAERNGVQSPKVLASSIGSPFSTVEAVAKRAFDLSPMSKAIGVDISTLEGMTYWPTGRADEVRFLGTTVDVGMILLKHRRACPQCMQEMQFHRAVWDLRIATACPVHKVRVIDRCQKCGRHLLWRAPTISRCTCGADIRTMVSEPVHASELIGPSFIYGALHLNGFSASEQGILSTLSFSDALSMLFHLGWFGSGARQPFSPVLISRRDIRPHEYMQIGINACSDWPNSFLQYLEGFCERSSSPYWRATSMRLLAEWVTDPRRSRALRTLLLPLIKAFIDRSGNSKIAYHVGRVLAHQSPRDM